MKKQSNKILFTLLFVSIICIVISAITLDEAKKNEREYWDKQNKERMDKWLDEHLQKEKQ